MQDLPFTSSRDACARPVLRRLLEVCGASWSQLVPCLLLLLLLLLRTANHRSPRISARMSPRFVCKNLDWFVIKKSHLRHPGSCIFYKKSKEGWSKSSLSCVHDPPITSGRRVTLPCKHFATPPPDVPRCSHRLGIPRKYFPGQKICFLLEKYARWLPRLVEEEEVVLVCVSERLLLYVTTAGAAAGGGGGQGLPHQSPCSTPASQPPGNIWSKLLTVVFEVVYPRHFHGAILGLSTAGPTYFTRVDSSTSFSGDAALVTSLWALDTWTPGHLGTWAPGHLDTIPNP